MKKEKYQRPSVQVVEVAPHAFILETSPTSGVEATRSGYGTATQQNWNESEVKSYRNPVDWDE